VYTDWQLVTFSARLWEASGEERSRKTPLMDNADTQAKIGTANCIHAGLVSVRKSSVNLPSDWNQVAATFLY